MASVRKDVARVISYVCYWDPGCPLQHILRTRVRRVNYHAFIGQAYVDGIMDYKGELNQDISDGEVKTEEFWGIATRLGCFSC